MDAIVSGRVLRPHFLLTPDVARLLGEEATLYLIP
jgi:hypothetical protein